MVIREGGPSDNLPFSSSKKKDYTQRLRASAETMLAAVVVTSLGAPIGRSVLQLDTKISPVDIDGEEDYPDDSDKASRSVSKEDDDDAEEPPNEDDDDGSEDDVVDKASTKFCLKQPKKLSFQRFFQGVPKEGMDFQRAFEVREYDKDDYMIEHHDAYPELSELSEPEDDEDAIALQEKLRELASRSVTDLRHKAFVPIIPAFGVGATVSSLVYPVLHALAEDATIFAPTIRNWTSPGCAARDTSCYFDSLPSLYDRPDLVMTNHTEEAKTTKVSFGSMKVDIPVVEDIPLNEVANIMRGHHDPHDPKASKVSKEWLVKKFNTPLGLDQGKFNLTGKFGAPMYDERHFIAKLDHRWLRRGRFWLMSQIVHFITRPNARLKAKLDKHKRELGRMQRPVLGLHVRKGDACGDRGECRDIEDYMPTIKKMQAKYGYKTVFLATPDPGVLKPEHLQKFPDVTFKFLQTTNTTELMHKLHYRKIDDAIAKGVVDAGDEFDEAMISAYMLADADGFIGGFSSNAARMAYSMLASGPRGCIKPFDSFDLNWCNAFGKGGDAILRRGEKSCSAARNGDTCRGDSVCTGLPCMISC